MCLLAEMESRGLGPWFGNFTEIIDCFDNDKREIKEEIEKCYIL